MRASIAVRPWLLGCLAWLAGCELYTLPLDDDTVEPPPQWQRVAVIDETPSRALDILFVIDDSGSMAEEQMSLIANFPAVINVLETIEGGLPDLHLGVVSTDVGAGPYNIISCAGDGDDGRLQVSAPGATCPVPQDAFIVDVANPAGGRDRNYTASLADTFACMAALGTTGCAFEQPLESMRRALDGSTLENAGFLRDEAQLLIVVLSDEDDCSARDLAVFDPAQTSTGDPLGALHSFRCFEFGVACESGNDDPRADGPRGGCVPQEDSAYLYGVQEYVDFVRGLKADPGQVSVAMIVGNSTPVAVGRDPERPQLPSLVPSCQSGAGLAFPAVRLAWFAAQFAGRTASSSICNENLSDAVVAAATLATTSATRCLPAEVTGSLAELATRCRGFDVVGLDTPAEARTPLPACTQTDGALPCLRFVPDEGCTLNPASAAVAVDRGGAAAPADALLLIECLP